MGVINYSVLQPISHLKMSSWEEIVGKFDKLKAPKVVNTILMCVYKTVLLHRKNLTTEAKEVDTDHKDAHENSLSFDEEQTIENFKGKKEDKPKFTYTAEVSETSDVKDDAGKIHKKTTGTKKQVVKNKVKWYSATADFKSSVLFLLQRYVKEVKDFYAASNDSFPDESTVLSEFATYSNNNISIDSFNLAPFVLSLTEKVHQSVDQVYADLDTYLSGLVGDLFKRDDGATPTKQVNKLMDKFVQFVKLLAQGMATHMWVEKCRADASLLNLLLRQYVLVTKPDAALDGLFFKTLSDYNTEIERLQQTARDEKKKKAAATVTDPATASTATADPATDATLGEALDDEANQLHTDDWDESADMNA